MGSAVVQEVLGPHDVLVSEHGYGLGPPTGILVVRYTAPDGPVRLAEVHDDFRDQLFWAADGWLVVRRGAELGFAGPHQGVWVRRGTSAEVRSGPGAALHAVLLRQPPAALADLRVGLVALDATARSAVTQLGRGVPEAQGPVLRAQLIAGLGGLEAIAHRDHGQGLARQIVSSLMSDPADPTELREWAERLHVSTRTIQRDFEREYGLTWSAWRTRHRLAASVPLLELFPVVRVAHLVGYASASAYVAAFRREYGTTPGRSSRRGQTSA